MVDLFSPDWEMKNLKIFLNEAAGAELSVLQNPIVTSCKPVGGEMNKEVIRSVGGKSFNFEVLEGKCQSRIFEI